MRLTKAMLEVMLLALNEVESGEGFQGIDNDKEQAEAMRNLTRAQDWIAQELDKRERKSP